jgi:hypothetical protein
MSAIQLTDERLRTWLTDQSDCERMCISVLTMQPDYTNVRPRRPVGGPDGGRDIEAVYKNKYVVWGAVGFRRKVTDSNEDEKWVKNKYKGDLASAQEQKPDLWGFVFFTNVDLTPGEVNDLEEYSHNCGIAFTDIFYRERLRIALDSPIGLAFRFQYLDISMNLAEQQAFFAHWGSQFDRFLQEGFDAIDRKLSRLEFLNECSKPLKRLHLVIQLKQACTPDELGHFRFLAQLLDLFQQEPFPRLFIAGRDAYGTWHSSEGSQQTVEVKSLAWSAHPEEELQNTIMGGGALKTDQIEVFAMIHKLGYVPKIAKDGLFKTLGNLDGLSLSMYMTKPLFEQMSRVALIANDYVIVNEPVDNLYIRDEPKLVPWLEELSMDQQSVPWGIVLCRTGWNLNFSQYTPMKL